MDILSGFTKSKPAADEPSHTDEPSHADKPEKHSNSDLLADAKVVAAAAQAQFSKDPENCDKGKAAHAAANLLDAAETYAKLDETQGVGKYVEQAEDYLRKYGAPAAGKETVPPTAAHGGAGEKTEEVVDKPSDGGAEKSEGKAGDLLKAAGSFFKWVNN